MSRSFGFVVAVILSPFHMFPNVNIQIPTRLLVFLSLPSEPAMLSLQEITLLLTSAPNNPSKHTHTDLSSGLANIVQARPPNTASKSKEVQTLGCIQKNHAQ